MQFPQLNELVKEINDLADPVTEQIYPIKELSHETREIIFTYELYLRHDRSCSNFLVALAKEPVMYNDARKISDLQAQ